MKQKFSKLLRLSALVALVLCGAGTAWGAQFTYDFSSGGVWNSSSSTITWTTNYFTILQQKGTSTTSVNSSYINAPRWYQTHKITFTPSAGITITEILFTCGSNNGQTISSSSGSVSTSGNNSTWKGTMTNSTPVTFTMGSQCRPTSITITYSGSTVSHIITAESNNMDYGTVSLSGTTITATPASGYRISTESPYTVTNGTATVTQNGNVFSVSASSDCTVRINFEAIPTYTVSFDAGDGAFVGNTDFPNTSNPNEAGTYMLPSATKDGYTFNGWVTGSNQPTTGSYSVSGNVDFTASYTRNYNSATYTVSTISAVTTSGTVPTGSSATFTQTYNTKCQMTSGNSMTLTLSGYQGKTVKRIVLSMRSNSSAGAGWMYARAGTTTLAAIGSENNGVAYNDNQWHGKYETSYKDVEINMTNTTYSIEEDLVIFIKATTNSLYCQSFTIYYEDASADPYISANDVNISGDAISGNISYTIKNPVDGGVLSASTEANWLTFGTVGTTVPFTCEANTSDAARTATVTLTYAYGSDLSVTNNITVTQAGRDYAILPFNWAGGASSTLTASTGVTANGLGSDYATGNAPYNVKFDGTGDYIQVKTNERPGIVTIGVKMIGGANTSKITVQGSADGETFTNVQELSISGQQNNELTLQTTNTFAATDRYVRLLFTKGANVGVGPITIAAGQIATISISENCYDGEGNARRYYGTYSNASAFVVPEGVTAHTVSVTNGILAVADYTSGAIVPANTGVMVSSATAGEKTVNLTTATTTVNTDSNMLRPTGSGITAENMAQTGYKFYYLTMNGSQIGFYRRVADDPNTTDVNEEGAAFDMLVANKAYLAVPENQTGNVKGFSFNEIVDGIKTVETKKTESNVIYNLAGQRVSKMQKGIYIVNGKKMLVK